MMDDAFWEKMDIARSKGRLRLMIAMKTPPRWKFWKRGLRDKLNKLQESI